MEKEVRKSVRKIFENLRKHQPSQPARKSDRINIDQMLREYNERRSRLENDIE